MNSPKIDEYWRWKSWIVSANEVGSGFPLQGLPFCAFRADAGETHLGVGIGDVVLDLRRLSSSGLLPELPFEITTACASGYLNRLMRCSLEDVSRLRRALMLLLREDADPRTREVMAGLLTDKRLLLFEMPVDVRNYTDFYASIHHATNVGRLFRPDQPLLPNYKYVPIGYHGRASSLVLSGAQVVRPRGQAKTPDEESPVFRPTRQLDYELEVGAYIARGNELGTSLPLAEAESHIFGISLVNDWSARDIQAWEYQPLGPFLGKSFATSVSPWVIPMEALEPFRVAVASRAEGDPEALPHLRETAQALGAIDCVLEVHLATRAMREKGQESIRLSSGNLKELYWSFAQMVAHHTSNGCNLLPGDLLASGTVSGADDGSLGSLLELTRRGADPLHLPNGETRSFLEDGDQVTLRGYFERPGLPRISLGECQGEVVAARS